MQFEDLNQDLYLKISTYFSDAGFKLEYFKLNKILNNCLGIYERNELKTKLYVEYQRIKKQKEEINTLFNLHGNMVKYGLCHICQRNGFIFNNRCFESCRIKCKKCNHYLKCTKHNQFGPYICSFKCWVAMAKGFMFED